MSIYGTSARQAGKFADEQQGGRKTENERRGVHSRKSNYSKRHKQQTYRGYWLQTFVIDAELSSRGGVMWS